MNRRESRQVEIGNVPVGGGAPVSVQSMTKTPTEDVEATLTQIRELADCGCEIIRVAVPSRKEVESLQAIKDGSPIPVVADIHFLAGLAVDAIKAGVDAIRINPGNIGSEEDIRRVAEAARQRSIPIRVGTNSGSVDLNGCEDVAVRLVDVCLECCATLEEASFRDIIVSFKASTCEDTVRAYRMAAERCDFPFHVGMTATGLARQGLVRSAVAIGTLLLDGIGDTIRVSLTGPPHEEVEAAYEILSAVGLRRRGPEIISCPTCGRCRTDVGGLAEDVRRRTAGMSENLTIAVMGCEVNGPGEAREADVGVAGAGGKVVLFSKGAEVRKIEASEAVEALVEEAGRISSERNNA